MANDLSSHHYIVGRDPGSPWPLLVLVLVFQGTYIFCCSAAALWLLRGLGSIAMEIRGKDRLFVYDLERRLGLSEYGPILTWTSLVGMCFQIYILAFRLVRMGQESGTAPLQVLKKILQLDKLSSPVATLGTAVGQGVDLSLAMLILTAFVPVVIYCRLPYEIWRVAERSREELAGQYHRAVGDNDPRDLRQQDGEVAEIERRWHALERSTVWPNGKLLGVGMLFIMLVFVIAAIAPGFAFYAVSTGVLLTAAKLFLGGKF